MAEPGGRVSRGSGAAQELNALNPVGLQRTHIVKSEEVGRNQHRQRAVRVSADPSRNRFHDVRHLLLRRVGRPDQTDPIRIIGRIGLRIAYRCGLDQRRGQRLAQLGHWVF